MRRNACIAHVVNAALLALVSLLGDATAAKLDLATGLQAEQQHAYGTAHSEQLDHVMEVLSSFKGFAASGKTGVTTRHAAEAQRLQVAMAQTGDEGVKLALSQSVTSNMLMLKETSSIFDSIAGFTDSLHQLLDTDSANGIHCHQMSCGFHASCTQTTLGAQCVCNEGYIGNGHECYAPPAYMPHKLLLEGITTPSKVADLHVAVFAHNKIAVVWRDVTEDHSGRMVVGNFREAGNVDLSPPETFTLDGKQAFDPKIAGTADSRIVVLWRDANHAATGWARGGVLGATGLRGAGMHITWSPKVKVCGNQAHSMAAVPLIENRVALLFAAKGTDRTVQSFGNSQLIEIGPAGALKSMGTFRFSDYAVLRLEVTKMSPTSFIIADRGGKLVDDMDPEVTYNQEANAIYGELVDGELVFNPNRLNLEPKQTQIWARGVSLVAPNTFAYAYETGTNQMKMAIVNVDPKDHTMSLSWGPKVLQEGSMSTYVNMLSVPYTAADPHTFIYYEGTNSSYVNICSWEAKAKEVKECEDFTWMPQRVSSVSGAHLGAGKAFMAFASPSGVPYYMVFGLSKK